MVGGGATSNRDSPADPGIQANCRRQVSILRDYERVIYSDCLDGRRLALARSLRDGIKEIKKQISWRATRRCAMDPTDRACQSTCKDVEHRSSLTGLINIAEDYDKLVQVVFQTLFMMFCRTNTNQKLSPHPSQNSSCLIRSVHIGRLYHE
jgi:hypothetical protein